MKMMRMGMTLFIDKKESAEKNRNQFPIKSPPVALSGVRGTPPDPGPCGRKWHRV